MVFHHKNSAMDKEWKESLFAHVLPSLYIWEFLKFIFFASSKVYTKFPSINHLGTKDEEEKALTTSIES